MIHPSTMAGPNWFTGSIGTTNPFQQSSFFRNTPGGPQPGFGPGNNPFQSQPFGFGTNTTQMQTMINEIIRQTIPTVLASSGVPTQTGFQSPFGYQTPFNTPFSSVGSFGFQSPLGFQSPFGFQTPTSPLQFGPQFPSTPWTSPFSQTSDWQNPTFFNELIRQATNQAIQNMWQQNPNPFGNNWQQQQNLTNTITQICLQACQQCCQTICQSVVACAIESSNPQNQVQNSPFVSQSPFGPSRLLQQQNLTNTIAQICYQACQQCCQTICQACIACATECLNSQSRTQNTPLFMQNTPFTTSSAPFNFNNGSPQFSFTPGIPTGAGAF